jgi:hypothetical protein
VIGTEGAGIIGAAGGQRQKIAIPFAGRAYNIRSAEAHVDIYFTPAALQPQKITVLLQSAVEKSNIEWCENLSKNISLLSDVGGGL